MKAAVMGVVQAHFRPEFINRLDDIVVFHPLDKAQIKRDRPHPDAIPGEAPGRAWDPHRNQRFGAPAAGQRGLRSDLRRASAQACDPVSSWRTRWRTKILSAEFVSGDVIRVDAGEGRLLFAKG
jgi:ATP-dependent Clp protease ATP-binding subunit ClpB